MHQPLSRRRFLVASLAPAASAAAAAILVACGDAAPAPTAAVLSTALSGVSPTVSTSSATAAPPMNTVNPTTTEKTRVPAMTANTSFPNAATVVPTIAGRGKTLDQLTIAVPSLPTTLDPQEANGINATRMYGLLYDKLIRRDWRNGGLLPGIATEWTRPTETTVEMTLRRDVVFHDGTPLTANDVKYTFDRYLTMPPPLLVSGFSALATVEVLDTYRVRFTTQETDSAIEARSTRSETTILPAAYHQRVGAKEFAVKPVGHGPYKLTEFVRDDHLSFAMHDRDFDGAPAARKVLVRNIPEVATRIASLLTGEVDLVLDVPPDQAPVLKMRKDLMVKYVLEPGVYSLTVNARLKPLDRKEVRQALDLAINRQVLVEQLFGGYAEWPRGLQGSGVPFYNPNRPQLPYDPEKAKALLKQAGYAGEEIRYLFASPNYYLLEREVAETVAGMWLAVGLNVKTDGLELATKGMEGDKHDSAYHVVTTSNNLEFDRVFFNAYGPKSLVQQRKFPPGYFTQFNDIVARATKTIDERKRADLYQQALDIFHDEVMALVLLRYPTIVAMKNTLDWAIDPGWNIDLGASKFKVL